MKQSLPILSWVDLISSSSVGFCGFGVRRSFSYDSLMTRFVDSVFTFFRLAEFEILFVLFFVIAYIIFKDLMARPDYNRILVDKPGGADTWPF